MQETFIGKERSLALNFFTEDFSKKIGFALSSHYTIKDNVIKIEIKSKDTVGPLSMAGINTEVVIPKINTGNYNLLINFNNIKISGKLEVTPRHYKISLAQNKSITVGTPTLNKIPLNTIFGTIHFNSKNNFSAANEFFDSLRAIGVTNRLLLPGNYNYFNVDSSGHIVQSKDKGYYSTKYFVFQYKGDESKLKKLVRYFSFKYIESMLFTLRTEKGDMYNIWTLD